MAPAKPAAGGARARLIEAAFHVVARDGLEAASVKTIAEEAGVKAGLVHYHFPSKDAVFEAALRQALEAYVARLVHLRETTPPDRLIGALLTDARGAADQERDYFRMRLSFCARAMSDPPLAALMRALTQDAAAELARLLAAARGAATPSSDDHARARMLKALFDGVMLNLLIDPSFPLQDAVAMTARMLDPSS